MMWFLAAMATEPAESPPPSVDTALAAAAPAGPPVWTVPVRLKLRARVDEQGRPVVGYTGRF